MEVPLCKTGWLVGYLGKRGKGGTEKWRGTTAGMKKGVDGTDSIMGCYSSILPLLHAENRDKYCQALRKQLEQLQCVVASFVNCPHLDLSAHILRINVLMDNILIFLRSYRGKSRFRRLVLILQTRAQFNFIMKESDALLQSMREDWALRFHETETYLPEAPGGWTLDARSAADLSRRLRTILQQNGPDSHTVPNTGKGQTMEGVDCDIETNNDKMKLLGINWRIHADDEEGRKQDLSSTAIPNRPVAQHRGGLQRIVHNSLKKLCCANHVNDDSTLGLGQRSRDSTISSNEELTQRTVNSEVLASRAQAGRITEDTSNEYLRRRLLKGSPQAIAPKTCQLKSFADLQAELLELEQKKPRQSSQEMVGEESGTGKMSVLEPANKNDLQVRLQGPLQKIVEALHEEDEESSREFNVINDCITGSFFSARCNENILSSLYEGAKQNTSSGQLPSNCSDQLSRVGREILYSLETAGRLAIHHSQGLCFQNAPIAHETELVTTLRCTQLKDETHLLEIGGFSFANGDVHSDNKDKGKDVLDQHLSYFVGEKQSAPEDLFLQKEQSSKDWLYTYLQSIRNRADDTAWDGTKIIDKSRRNVVHNEAHRGPQHLAVKKPMLQLAGDGSVESVQLRFWPSVNAIAGDLHIPCEPVMCDLSPLVAELVSGNLKRWQECTRPQCRGMKFNFLQQAAMVKQLIHAEGFSHHDTTSSSYPAFVKSIKLVAGICDVTLVFDEKTNYKTTKRQQQGLTLYLTPEIHTHRPHNWVSDALRIYAMACKAVGNRILIHSQMRLKS